MDRKNTNGHFDVATKVSKYEICQKMLCFCIIGQRIIHVDMFALKWVCTFNQKLAKQSSISRNSIIHMFYEGSPSLYGDFSVLIFQVCVHLQV